ncbi:hypothetical protein AJ79_02999 [Helicocarpus griseus UAMH5409]|uniref:Uncharacterized protein n=1 Tax=Helicocarpus griseus UAMH5409 TaxID=1447875 RepID=A0A2B7XZ69_9EURO|nr:hypothetical protein AJ79_02999 [Helicocarpus griseus UAMH5409]
MSVVEVGVEDGDVEEEEEEEEEETRKDTSKGAEQRQNNSPGRIRKGIGETKTPVTNPAKTLVQDRLDYAKTAKSRVSTSTVYELEGWERDVSEEEGFSRLSSIRIIK